MDTTQLLLSTSVTITTVLLIIVSVQLISLLKQLKKDHLHENKHVVKTPEVKKEKTVKKRINLTTLLDKMRSHISRGDLSKKRFFKSS
jgi:hypothetical protein